MPRMRRTVVPDYPHHILQRGHNGQEVFKDEEDYLKYLTDLRELKEKWHVKVYGWCLLPEQVHMLVDPGPNPDMLSELMKALAARTTRHRNRKDKRSGTLWESRYRSSVVQRGSWTLACLRYLEKRPGLPDLATLGCRSAGRFTVFSWNNKSRTRKPGLSWAPPCATSSPVINSSPTRWKRSPASASACVAEGVRPASRASPNSHIQK